MTQLSAEEYQDQVTNFKAGILDEQDALDFYTESKKRGGISESFELVNGVNIVDEGPFFNL